MGKARENEQEVQTFPAYNVIIDNVRPAAVGPDSATQPSVEMLEFEPNMLSV